MKADKTQPFNPTAMGLHLGAVVPMLLRIHTGKLFYLTADSFQQSTRAYYTSDLYY
jgi:hypothetical protein